MTWSASILDLPRAGRQAAKILILATVYFLAGRWGLQLGALGDFAAPVWAPTGIALFALRWYGYELWPGVFLGALATNAVAGAAIPLATAIAVGNTFEAVAGCYFLRLFQFRPAITRLRDVATLFLAAGVASTLISATIGTAALWVAHRIPAQSYLATWQVWWLGDMLSVIIVAAFLFLWASTRIRIGSVRRWLEAMFVTLVLVLVTDAVFSHPYYPDTQRIALPYLVFPPLMWAAMRFGPSGAVTATFVTGVLALSNTLHGFGPFGLSVVNEDVFGLQLFMAVIGVTSLVLAALAAERAESRQQTVESEGRFRTLLENSADGILLLSPAGEINYIAPTRRRLLGYTDDEILGMKIFELLHPDDREAALLAFQSILQAPSRVETVQARVMHKEGTWRWMEGTGSNCLGNAAMRGIVVNFRDISANKQAESALLRSHEELEESVKNRTRELVAANTLLKESEDRFRFLVESVDDYAIFGLDPKGRVTTWNSGAERFKGYRADEIIGQHFSCFYTPEDIRNGLPQELLRHAAEEGRIRDEGWRVRKDGTRFFAETVITALWDKAGTLRGFSKITRDITERRRLDEKLRRSQEQLVEAQRLAHLGNWEWDLDQNTMSWSDELYRIFGLPPQGFRILFPDVLRYTHPQDRHLVKQTIRLALKTHEPFSIDLRISRGKDDERFLHAIGKVFVDAAGRPVKVLGTAQDVTDQRRSERALQEKEEELFQARKLEAIGRLAGGVAHDFNNLITGILGICQDLKGTFPLNDPRRDELEEVVKASNRAFDVTRQLLAFGRRQVVSPKVIDVNATIKDFAKLLHRLLGEDVRLELQLSEESHVTMDPGNLGQILLNLALNARDALPQGGTITIRTTNVMVETNPRSRVLLEVSDNGKGMTSDVMAHIFEPFYTTKSNDKGTGLGLATVYGIVKQSGGDINVESRQGKGSTFRISLPREAAAKPAESTPMKTAQPPATQGFVLVIEDEDIVRRVVVKRLKHAGYRVLEARDGKSALEIVAQKGLEIELVVTDVVMPEMNGREVVTKIHALYPNIVVLYMSGYPEEIIAHKGILEPGINFIEKVAIQRELIQKVRDVLAKHKPTVKESVQP
jgi:two-component system, cell cycle sensor histidine kinase and response regulator CckA